MICGLMWMRKAIGSKDEEQEKYSNDKDLCAEENEVGTLDDIFHKIDHGNFTQ